VTLRKSILLLISLSAIAALVACGGSSSSTPPPAAVTVAVGTVTSPLVTNSQNSITATVTNDSTNAGVTWTCSGATNCGSFNPATSTGSSATTTYTAPPFPASGITITATSVASTSATGTATGIAIVGPTVAAGNYVFSVTGQDVNGTYTVIGVINVGATGAITGEQDFTDFLNPDLYDQINTTGSSIATDADGNITLTLVTCDGSTCTSTDTNVGASGTETFDGSVLPLSTTGRAFLTEFDASGSGSGELDAQSSSAFTAGTAPGPVSYAFALNGVYNDDGNAVPIAVGGVIDVDGAAGSGAISGATSIFDVNAAGELFPAETFNASTVSTADTFGRIQFTLNASTFDQMLLSGYIVDGTHIRLVEGFDGTYDTFGGANVVTGGTGLVQNSSDVPTTAAGDGFTNAGAVGTYVFGMNGADPEGAFQAAGQLSLATTGVSGFVDFNDLVNSSGSEAVSPDPVTATTYAVDAFAAGDYTISTIEDSQATPNVFNLQVYLDGNGNALAISMDNTDVLAGYGFQQASGLVGTFAASNFSGSYGLDVTGWGLPAVAAPFSTNVNEFELDAVGPTSATSGALAGTVDLNYYSATPTETTGLTVTGAIGTSGANTAAGIFSGSTITGLDVTTCATTCTADAFNYYLYDAAGDSFLIETDLLQLTLGYSAQQ
jgi:hypothetical protein